MRVKPVLCAIWVCSFFFGGCFAPALYHSESFPVVLEVDFGPSQKPLIHRTVSVAPRTTPGQLLAMICQVEKGAVCCDERETAGIDGVKADPATNRWWTVSINGSKKNVSPFKTTLKQGDIVRWEYRQYEQ